MLGSLGDGIDLCPPALGRSALCATVATAILGQVHRAYPCSAQQVLSGPADLQLPTERFRCFWGSFDWHSSVHSHWALARMVRARVLPVDIADQATEVLDQDLDPAVVDEETRSWRALPEHTELPYGLTWLLQLASEVDGLDRLPASGVAPSVGDPAATDPSAVGSPHEGVGDLVIARRGYDPYHGAPSRWEHALDPMVDLMTARLDRWLDGLALPIRSGIHSDTAWSLAMLWDRARATADTGLMEKIDRKARALYEEDGLHPAPVHWEPAGQTFTSAILNEAALMARVLPQPVFTAWLQGFLPGAFTDAPAADPGRCSGAGRLDRGAFADASVVEPDGGPGTGRLTCGATPGTSMVDAGWQLLPDLPRAWDGTDYFGVHEVALPLARALCASDVAAALPASSSAHGRMVAAARAWARQGLEGVTLQGHLADHWVGSFILATIL